MEGWNEVFKTPVNNTASTIDRRASREHLTSLSVPSSPKNAAQKIHISKSSSFTVASFELGTTGMPATRSHKTTTRRNSFANDSSVNVHNAETSKDVFFSNNSFLPAEVEDKFSTQNSSNGRFTEENNKKSARHTSLDVDAASADLVPSKRHHGIRKDETNTEAASPIDLLAGAESIVDLASVPVKDQETILNAQGNEINASPSDTASTAPTPASIGASFVSFMTQLMDGPLDLSTQVSNQVSPGRGKSIPPRSPPPGSLGASQEQSSALPPSGAPMPAHVVGSTLPLPGRSDEPADSLNEAASGVVSNNSKLTMFSDPFNFRMRGKSKSEQMAKQAAKSEEYRSLFDLPLDEVLVEDFNCALQKKILYQGHLYLFEQHICFFSNIFGYEKKVIPLKDVTAVRKANTAKLFPNAIEVVAWGQKFLFASFLSRDEAYRLIISKWVQCSGYAKLFLGGEAASAFGAPSPDDVSTGRTVLEDAEAPAMEARESTGDTSPFKEASTVSIRTDIDDYGELDILASSRALFAASPSVLQSMPDSSGAPGSMPQSALADGKRTSMKQPPPGSSELPGVAVATNGSGTSTRPGPSLRGEVAEGRIKLFDDSTQVEKASASFAGEDSRTAGTDPAAVLKPVQLSAEQETPVERRTEGAGKPAAAHPLAPGISPGASTDILSSGTTERPSANGGAAAGTSWQPDMGREDIDGTVPPPAVTPGMKTICEAEFMVSVRQFFGRFFSDQGINFLQAFHGSRGDTDFVCSPWVPEEDRNASFVRSISFRHPLNFFLGPKNTACLQSQRCQTYQGGHILVETSQQMPDIPLGDYFVVKVRWDLEQRGPAMCHLRVAIEVPFLKKTLLQKQIERGAVDESRETYLSWIADAREDLKNMVTMPPQPVQSRGASGSTRIEAATQATPTSDSNFELLSLLDGGQIPGQYQAEIRRMLKLGTNSGNGFRETPTGRKVSQSRGPPVASGAAERTPLRAVRRQKKWLPLVASWRVLVVLAVFVALVAAGIQKFAQRPATEPVESSRKMMSREYSSISNSGLYPSYADRAKGNVHKLQQSSSEEEDKWWDLRLRQLEESANFLETRLRELNSEVKQLKEQRPNRKRQRPISQAGEHAERKAEGRDS